MKKAISILLAVVIAISVIVPGLTGLDFATLKAEAATSKASDAYATVFTASDFQDNFHGNKVVSNLKAMVNSARSDGITDEPDAFIFGGDFTSASYGHADTTLTVPRLTEAVHDIYPYYNTQNIVNVQGNHDVFDASMFNATGLHKFDNFLVYVINLKDYPASRGDGALEITEATAEALTATFDQLLTEGETRPIFIATHLPLHYNSRNPSATNPDGSVGYNENHYGLKLFDTINAYATVFDIVFLFGHNHSGDYDDYIGGGDSYIGRGETMKLHNNVVGVGNFVERTLNFTYMNYGYIGYSNSENDNTSTMGAFEICPDRIEVTRYSATGVHKTHEIERINKLNQPTVNVAGYNSGTLGSATGAIATASGFTDPVYTWTSNNNNIAKISADGRVAQISYNQAGTATVTVTVTERNNSSKTASDSYSVIVENKTNPVATTIRTATQIVNDKTLEYYKTPFGTKIALIGSYEGLSANATTSWTSSNASVATVNQYGEVTFVGGGSTFITYTVTDSSKGYTASAKVKLVVSSEKEVKYKFVQTTTIEAGKSYVLADSYSGTSIFNDTTVAYDNVTALQGISQTFEGSSGSYYFILEDDSYVWNAIEATSSSRVYLQNESSGLYLNAYATGTNSVGGNTSLGYFELTSSPTGNGIWLTNSGLLQTTNNLKWYPRGSDRCNITSGTGRNCLLFERVPLDPSAEIEFRGEVANGTTQTVYSVTDTTKVALYGDYTNVQELKSETWTSSNQSVATIDANGVLAFTGAQGETTVTYTVTDAASNESVSASVTIITMLAAQEKRIFKHVTRIQAGKNYVVATKAGEIGDAFLLSSFRDTNSTLLAEPTYINASSGGEYYVEINVDDNYPVWIAEADGSFFNLKSEKEGRYLYAKETSNNEGTVSTSVSVGADADSTMYQWTCSNPGLYNQYVLDGENTYLRSRTANFVGMGTKSQSEYFFYEEASFDPNGVITSRYENVGSTLVRNEICPDQTEKFVPKAEYFPDNDRVTFVWASDNAEVATIDQNGVITYTGKPGVVNVTLTSTSLEYDISGNKPVDTTTVKIFVNGGVEENPEIPDDSTMHFELVSGFTAGKKYILRAVKDNESGNAISIAVSGTKNGTSKLEGLTVSPVNGIITTEDKNIVWVSEAGSDSSYFYLKNADTGEYLRIDKNGDIVTTSATKDDNAQLIYYNKQNKGQWVIGSKASSANLIRYSDGFYESSSGAVFELYEETDAPSGGGDVTEKNIFYLTDAFEVGKKYIIAHDKTVGSSAHVMSNQLTENTNDTSVGHVDELVKSNSKGTYIANPSDSVEVFEAVESSQSGYVLLRAVSGPNAGKYLHADYNSRDIYTKEYANNEGDDDRPYSFTTGTSSAPCLKIFNSKDLSKNVWLFWDQGGNKRYYVSSTGSYSTYIYELDESTVPGAGDPEVPDEPETKVSVQIRTVDYFGSVDITNVMQYRYEITNGKTEKIYRYTEGVNDNYTYTWTSSDESIATVNASTGLVTYKGKDGNVTFSLRVTGTDENGEAVDRTVSTTFRVSSQPYQLSNNDYPSYPEEGSIRVNKTASNATGDITFQESGVTEVELGVTGVPVEQPVDVVVVFDHSGSMGPEKMQSAIRDTRNFAFQLFNENENNRLALVTFDQYRSYYDSITSNSMGELNEGTEDRIVTGNGTIQNAFSTANDLDKLVEDLASLENNNEDGTNYDSGLNYAYRILQYAKANGGNTNQVVIFMSDGAATKFNGLKISGSADSESLDKAWLLGDESYFIENGYFDENGVPKDEYPAAALFNPNGDNWFAAAIKAPAGQPVEGMPNVSFYNGYHTGLGAKIYTIGYAVSSNSEEEAVLSNIATEPSYFYSAATNLQPAYDSILEQILYSATNAVVTDKMGDHFDVQFATSFEIGNDTVTLDPVPKFEIGYWTLDNVGNRVADSYNVIETITFTTNSNGILNGANSSVIGSCYDEASSTVNGRYVSYNLNTETFTWNIGEINRNEITLKYYACLEGAATGEREAGTFATNEYATLTYTNYRGTVGCTKAFPVPTLAWDQASVSYDFYLVNAQGLPVNLSGVVVPFSERVTIGREQTKQILLNNDGEVTYSLIASEELPEGYELYNPDAYYTVNVSSISANSYATIYDDTLTTYFRDGSKAINVNGNVLGATGYTNTAVSFAVKTSQGVIPDSVVIDYGLPVKISVLGNDYVVDGGALTGVAKSVANGTELNNVSYTSSKLTNGGKEDVAMTYGKATIDGEYIIYTPTRTDMGAEEVFYYEYNVGGKYYYTTVTVIPAANIYYEETFMTFIDGQDDYKWVDAGESITDKFQAEDRPGTFAFDIFDADNAYGDDPAYNDSYTYSLGNAKKTTVDAAAFGKEAKATFTFCGTGFDLFSVTNSDTGAVQVTIYNAGTTTIYKNFLVNTYYGYSYDESGNLLPGSSSTLYQVPVVSRRDLAYGTYDVVIKPLYSSAFDPNYSSTADRKDNNYSIYVDSVRIFNPAGAGNISNKVIKDAYYKDGEYAPVFMEIRDTIISAETFNENIVNGLNLGYTGSIFLDGKASNSGESALATYKNQGPKNELYLAKGQAVAFNLSSEDKEALASLQLGMKVVSGSSEAEVTIMNTGEKYPNSITLNSTHETFKKLNSAIIWNNKNITYGEDNKYETVNPIVIANTSDEATVISLTSFKWAHTTKPETGDAEPAVVDFMVYESTPAYATMALRRAMTVSEEPEESKTYNEEDISMEWSDGSFVEGKEATLKVTTPPEVVKVTVGGIEIDKCEIDENGNKLWTYTFVVQQAGENAYEVIFYDYNGDASEPVMTETIIVEEAPDEPTTDEPTTDEPTTDEPTTDEPTTDEPTTDEPTTDEPTTDEPTTDEPETDEPSTDEPVTEPSTDDSAFDKVMQVLSDVFNKVFSFLKSIIEFFWRLF